MNTVAIIQARMSSTRLPGKVLLELGGYPVIGNIYNRMIRSRQIHKCVVATSTKIEDDAIEDFCITQNIECFRGSEEDVLERFYYCAKKYYADIIVRLTGDNALVDPAILDEGLIFFRNEALDYLYYHEKLPLGMAVEIFNRKSLELAYKEADNCECREHVTPYIRRNPQKFKVVNYIDKNDTDYSGYRFTMDSIEDYNFVSKIYNYFKRDDFSLCEIMDVLFKNPDWKEINANVIQKQIQYHQEYV